MSKKQGGSLQQTHANVNFSGSGATMDQVQMVLHLRFLPPLGVLVQCGKWTCSCCHSFDHAYSICLSFDTENLIVGNIH